MIQFRDYQLHAIDTGLTILNKLSWVYLGMEVRTGKTLTAFGIAEGYKARSVLFLTKKLIMKDGGIERDYSALNPSFLLKVANYEMMGKLDPKDKTGSKIISGKIHPAEFDLIIIDEPQNFGTFPKPSERQRVARIFCKGKPIIYTSGTPSPESYSQLFHQFQISSWSPLSQWPNFYRFADSFVTVKDKRVGAGQIVKDYSDCNGNLVWQYIKHGFVRVTQEQAGFTSFVDEHFLRVDMMPDTINSFNDMAKHKMCQVLRDEDKLFAIANSGAAMVNKLAQLSSGTIIVDAVDDQIIEAGQRQAVILDESKAFFIWEKFKGKKIAIFYYYKAELELLKRVFPRWTVSPDEFNNCNDKTFLGQMKSAREGISLKTADALVAYNVDFSATTYFQMRARLQDKDRIASCPLYWIFSSHGIEPMIYQAVSNKINFTHSYYKNHAKSRSYQQTHIGETDPVSGENKAEQSRPESPQTNYFE